jgi:hypothetical protein
MRYDKLARQLDRGLFVWYNSAMSIVPTFPGYAGYEDHND